MITYSVIRDEHGVVVGELKIETSLPFVRVPFLIKEGRDHIFGELDLQCRHWRTADGKVEPCLFVHSSNVSWLEKVKGFTQEPPR